MRYLSVCSGMEAASVAWEPLGFTPVGFSEIDAFPSAILKHRFPNVKNYGDLTKHAEWQIEPGTVDILVGGTPCQSFSVAGLRGGLADPRGNLALVFLGLADRLKPRWIVWENVPGFLSSDGGRSAGSFLGALGELGYGWAYRVLDAQNFGVPQRRRRVFVVGYLGDPAVAGKVLFEPESLCWDTKTRNKKRQDTASDASESTGTEGERTAFGRNNTIGPIDQSGCVTTSTERHDFATDTFIIERAAYRKSRRAQSDTDFETWVDDGKANTINLFENTDVRTTHAVVEQSAIPIDMRNATRDPEKLDEVNRQGLGVGKEGDPSHTVTSEFVNGVAQSVSFQVGNLVRRAGPDPSTESFGTLVKDCTGDQKPCVAHEMVVRRLTPVECERLQGFPDNWSRIPWRGKPDTECPDGLRYAACGNSMAVPVMRWIGERIKQVNSNLTQ